MERAEEVVLELDDVGVVGEEGEVLDLSRGLVCAFTYKLYNDVGFSFCFSKEDLAKGSTTYTMLDVIVV